MKKKEGKVILGMSGGVDSTAAALLLQQQGYEVIGLHFDVLGRGEDSADCLAAKQAAEKLDISLVYRNVAKEFEESVIQYFQREYLKGRTPNPCVFCNKEMKFQILLKEADAMNAAYIATGHYAQVVFKNGQYYLKKGLNEKKDQSYVLWRLEQKELSRLLLPLGTFTSKEEIRKILHIENFDNAQKKDSQEICFIPDNDYVLYLKEHMRSLPKAGNFVNQKGEILGRHRGIINYTIGQRKGLGITFGKPMFVTKINAEDNTITLGENHDLMTDLIISSHNNFINQKLEEEREYQAKIRYASILSKCKIKLKDDLVYTYFQNPQRAATPGQSIVWYDEQYLIGGGIIENI